MADVHQLKTGWREKLSQKPMLVKAKLVFFITQLQSWIQQVYFSLETKIHFLFNVVKSPEKFICDIQFVEQCSIRGVLTKFCRKVPFWGPYWPLNYFSHKRLNFSRQDASFEHPYDYIWNHNFFDQKSGKIGRNPKILSPTSWSVIFSSGFVFSFFDLMDIKKVSIFSLFWGFF